MTLAVRFGRLFVLTGLALGACAALAAESRGELREGDSSSRAQVLTVCAVPASMPRSDKTPEGTPRGLDVAVIEAVGRILGRSIEFHWCADADCAWHCLPAGRCDAVVGQPFESAATREIAWSVPYAGAQFGLVVSRGAGGVRSLADLHGKRVGIVSGTVAVSEKNH